MNSPTGRVLRQAHQADFEPPLCAAQSPVPEFCPNTLPLSCSAACRTARQAPDKGSGFRPAVLPPRSVT